MRSIPVRSTAKVYRLLDGPCGAEDQQWLESHLAECAQCRQELERATERIRRYPGDLSSREGLARSLNNMANLYRALSAVGEAERDVSSRSSP